MNATTRKARKRHRCTACEEWIEVGEEYEDIVLTPWSHQDNDGYGSWKLHSECSEYFNAEYCKESDGYINEPSDFKECFEEYYPDKKYRWEV